MGGAGGFVERRWERGWKEKREGKLNLGCEINKSIFFLKKKKYF